LTDRLSLCYHAVSDGWRSPYSIAPGVLEWQLRYVLRRAYEPVGFTELVAGGGAGKRVAVTFDDAHRSVFQLAFPLLERLGMTATLFVPTGLVNGGGPLLFEGYSRWLGGPWERELEPMSWSEIEVLASAGWEIGSHSRSHPRLTTLDPGRLAEELADSKRELERRLGRPCTSFAYPYSDHDDRVCAAAAAAGYSVAGTVGNSDPAPFAWPRHQVLRHESPAYFKRRVSPLFRSVRRSPAWPLLRAAARGARAARAPLSRRNTRARRRTQ
jgi:peptidoglycan/xylan/chitin deacetylase (PgdA/CDA1 family)